MYGYFYHLDVQRSNSISTILEFLIVFGVFLFLLFRGWVDTFEHLKGILAVVLKVLRVFFLSIQMFQGYFDNIESFRGYFDNFRVSSGIWLDFRHVW